MTVLMVTAGLRSTANQSSSYSLRLWVTRQVLLSHPEVVVRADEACNGSLPVGPGALLLQDLDALRAIVGRAEGRIIKGAVRELLPPEHDDLRSRTSAARRAAQRLFTHITEEIDHARRAATDNHSDTV